ncbi:hypothetical protein [Terrabacter sp. C0L_2]|uniref:hypothetical protein n=1 Tax=Terrabacter sp. C0L_2 TaxID=3108389 RepID=UPI002ED5FC54|nr:hypothetical protein U5C87_10735 [Terrabacter sp. C0L_2]
MAQAPVDLHDDAALVLDVTPAGQAVRRLPTAVGEAVGLLDVPDVPPLGWALAPFRHIGENLQQEAPVTLTWPEQHGAPQAIGSRQLEPDGLGGERDGAVRPVCCAEVEHRVLDGRAVRPGGRIDPFGGMSAADDDDSGHGSHPPLDRLGLRPPAKAWARLSRPD